MPEIPSSGAAPNVPPNLHELADTLRQARSLNAAEQAELSELIDELARTLEGASVPAAEKAHLLDTTAHLVRSLHQQRDGGLLRAARERLEEAVTRAEAEAPVAAGIVRRLLELLANLGI